MSDRLEDLGTLCLLTPVADVAGLRAVLESWPRGAESPIARVPHTHFARFVVIDGIERQVAEQPDDDLHDKPYLMASAFFDGDPIEWLDAALAALPDELHTVGRHCRGYPGRDPSSFRRWLLDHRVEATAVFGAYPHARVSEVRDALRFRRRFRDFAFAMQRRGGGLDDFRRFWDAER